MVSAGEKRVGEVRGACRDLLAEQVEEVWNWTTCDAPRIRDLAGVPPVTHCEPRAGRRGVEPDLRRAPIGGLESSRDEMRGVL